MRHDEFSIGTEFRCGDRRWRCTDVGTRIVVAICLEPHEIVEMDGREQRHVMTDDSSWFVGPPYAVAEIVFDENDFPACMNTRSQMAAIRRS